MKLGEELLSAIEDDDITRVNFCLLAGADANYRGDLGITPLGEAIRHIGKGPNPEIVKILLKWGANPNALWGNCATTPFFSLVQNSTSGRAGSVVLSNQVACVRLLLKHGADPNRKQGLFGKSSLEYAIMREGDLELVKALVEGGAEITDEIVRDATNDEVKRCLCSSMYSVSQQAETVATWLRGHLTDTKWAVATNGTGRVVVSGSVRGYSPNVDDCSLSFDLDGAGGHIVCRGVLSRAVPAERLPDVQNLLFHYGFRSRVSIGALALGRDRKVQCSAAIPMLALRTDPKGTTRRLSVNVMIPLLELSDAVMRVCRDGQKPEAALEAAAFPKDVEQLLKDPDAEDVDWDATSEAEELIESWFDFFGVKYRRGIETELTVYYLEDGNASQNLRECFVMCGDMVLVQFRSKFEIPEGQRKAVSDLALARNAMHQVVSICMGYGAELGDSVYFQYLMPVSVLRAWKRGSSAKEDFRRMLDMLRSYALESLDMMDVAPCTR